MITPRQKTRMDDAAPVLFRLPNLRTRGKGPKALKHVSAEAVSENQPATATSSCTTAESGPEPLFPTANCIASPVSPPIAEPSITGDPPQSSRFVEFVAIEPQDEPKPTIHAARPEPSTAIKHVSSPQPMERGWMERVGSRLILILTLLVIVSAAWITGRRMPASKPTVSSGDLVQTAKPDGEPSTPGKPPIDRQETVMPQASSASKLAGPLASVQPEETTNASQQLDSTNAKEMPSAAMLSAAMLRATQPPAGVSQIDSNITTLLPPNRNDFAAVNPRDQAVSESAETNSMVSLEPSRSIHQSPSHQASKPSLGDSSLSPPSDGTAPISSPVNDSLFYTAEDISRPSQTQAQAVSLQTRTPNAPSIDPEVLIPWATENLSMRAHQRSATPNPIDDWSKYLPSAPAAAAYIRTTSALESPGDTAVQQAVYPLAPTAPATVPE